MTLNALETITIYAFLEAVRSQTAPLPLDLQKSINEVGKIFVTDTKVAVDRLLELAKHDRLRAVYEQARRDIQQPYVPKERNDNIDIPDNPEPPPEILENLQAVFMAPDSTDEKEKEQSTQLIAKLKGWFKREN